MKPLVKPVLGAALTLDGEPVATVAALARAYTTSFAPDDGAASAWGAA